MQFKEIISTIAAFILMGAPLASLAEISEAPTTWEEYDAQALSLAPVVSLLAAELTDGRCTVVHDLNGEMTTPIGSSFKLYILAELASQIGKTGKAGSRLDWSTLLKIQQKFKSIPGGPLLFVPVGSIYTIRYIAEQMIQVSDNTATDHLLFLAGRENVERRMRQSGHHDPLLNVPLVATREFAVMKFLWTDEELQDYQQASVKKRRKILANEKRGWTELEAFFDEQGEQTEPVRVETVEWYADRYDMCDLMKSIHKLGQKAGLRPVLEVLTLADPIKFEREQWTYVGFKGGSEMGLLASNWLLERDDGRLFFYSAVFMDPDAALDLDNIIPLLADTPDLLYLTP